MKRPILFLDFDGVLNTPATWCKRPLGVDTLDADKVQRLAALVDRIDADVVISSSWRYIHDLDDLRSILAAKGLPEYRVLDVTPRAADAGGDRGAEVSAWLERLIGKPAFVIVDDLGLSSFEGLGRHLVTVDGARGLTDRDCQQIERVIERQVEEMKS
jgi:hypothetical protein